MLREDGGAGKSIVCDDLMTDERVMQERERTTPLDPDMA